MISYIYFKIYFFLFFWLSFDGNGGDDARRSRRSFRALFDQMAEDIEMEGEDNIAIPPSKSFNTVLVLHTRLLDA